MKQIFLTFSILAVILFSSCNSNETLTTQEVTFVKTHPLDSLNQKLLIVPMFGLQTNDGNSLNYKMYPVLLDKLTYREFQKGIGNTTLTIAKITDANIYTPVINGKPLCVIGKVVSNEANPQIQSFRGQPVNNAKTSRYFVDVIRLSDISEDNDKAKPFLVSDKLKYGDYVVFSNVDNYITPSATLLGGRYAHTIPSRFSCGSKWLCPDLFNSKTEKL